MVWSTRTRASDLVWIEAVLLNGAHVGRVQREVDFEEAQVFFCMVINRKVDRRRARAIVTDLQLALSGQRR